MNPSSQQGMGNLSLDISILSKEKPPADPNPGCRPFTVVTITHSGSQNWAEHNRTAAFYTAQYSAKGIHFKIPVTHPKTKSNNPFFLFHFPYFASIVTQFLETSFSVIFRMPTGWFSIHLLLFNSLQILHILFLLKQCKLRFQRVLISALHKLFPKNRSNKFHSLSYQFSKAAYKIIKY